MADLLLQAMEAKQNGNLSLAKQLLAQAIVQDPRSEGAWMMMSEVVDDVKLKRNCLERVLAINPNNTAASVALMKLSTSPLGPVLRGERYKPITPTEQEKIPPFTPPFTWTGDESQFQALGDLTFPDLTGEKTNQPPESSAFDWNAKPITSAAQPPETAPMFDWMKKPDEKPSEPPGAPTTFEWLSKLDEKGSQPPEAPTTFDWASESEEPDKTIDKIFDAVSNPELASEPLPDSDLDWLNNLRPAEELPEVEAPEQMADTIPVPEEIAEPEVNLEVEELPIEHELTPDDFKVSAEPEWGMRAFATEEIPPSGYEEPEPLLWDNPHARRDRLIILGNTSIIYANPASDDMSQIMELFNDKKMDRNLLGQSAGTIKLDTIQRMQYDPRYSDLKIFYNSNDKLVNHEIKLENRSVREEILTALKLRLGSNYSEYSQSFSMLDKLLSPLIWLVLIAAVAWALVGGVPLLSQLPAFQLGTPYVILYNIQYYVNLIGTTFIILIAVVLGLACLAWLGLNLSKPTSRVTIEWK